MNDKQLIKKCQNGEREAFDDLIRMYYPYVSRFLLRTCGDEYLSQDLTQETFLKMINNIEKYDLKGKAGFGTWLITIARNTYIDHLRKNNIVIEEIDENLYAPNSDITDQISARLEYEKVIEMISDLPKEQGIAIRLKYEEGLTLDEIAEKFGVSSGTIKSRIHEGTVKLRDRLKIKTRRGNGNG